MSNSTNDPQAGNYGQEAAGFASTNGYGTEPGNKFGTSGYNPNAYGGPIQEPAKFTALKRFTLISLLVYVISQAVSMIPFMGAGSVDYWVEAVEAGGATVGEEELEAIEMISGAFTTMVIVLGVVMVGLYLLVYLGLKNTKNWGRILGMIFAFIGLVVTLGSLLGTMGSFGGTAGMIGLALTLIWAAVTIYWLVLAFSGEVVEYLESMRR